jgi:methyl-accepting chemotaxis protein
MTNPQEQLTELTRRTQENFKHLWEQWSQRSNELLKGVGSRSRSAGDAPGNPEEVLDAVFDFAENLIAQQRAFAKQMLHAASRGQQTITQTADVADSTASPTGPTGVVGTPGVPGSTTTPGASPTGTPGS